MKRNSIISKYTVMLLIFALLFGSCDNWLDIAPEKNLIKNNFWKKTEDANSALAAIYSSVRYSSFYSFVWGEVRADMVTGFGGGFAPITGSDISPSNKVINWAPYYNTINLSNTFLYFSKDVMANDRSFTLEMKNAMDAEAIFLRSLSYFYLVRLWNRVPLVMNASVSDTCDIYPEKSEESVILNRIIADLNMAKEMAYSDKNVGNPALFKGRANKYSILALLADIYLWKEDYAKSIECCDIIEQSGHYSLEPFESWFTIYNPGNSRESIFELQCADDLSDRLINPLYGFYDVATTTYFQFVSLQKKILNLSKGSMYSTLFQDASDVRSCNGKGAPWKFIGIDLKSELVRSSVNERNTGILYYRYSDVLLMHAEALNESGKTNEALPYLTQVPERAGLLPISEAADKVTMRELILNERAKEFVLEGKRWFDLLRAAKRNNYAEKDYVKTVLINNVDARSRDLVRSKVNDYWMYYLPVPYDELKRNNKLKQNTFYER